MGVLSRRMVAAMSPYWFCPACRQVTPTADGLLARSLGVRLSIGVLEAAPHLLTNAVGDGVLRWKWTGGLRSPPYSVVTLISPSAASTPLKGSEHL